MPCMRDEFEDEVIGLQISAAKVKEGDGACAPSLAFVEGLDVEEVFVLPFVKES